MERRTSVLHTITQNLKTEADTLAFAASLAKAIEDGAIIFLDGQLGVGKTTFARGFLRGFGFGGKVKSPTYTLVEPYEINERHVFHFDCYRLDEPHALLHIGIHEYFFPEAICLIEWPEKGAQVLPAPDLTCHLSVEGDGRVLRVEAHSARGEKILTAIQT